MDQMAIKYTNGRNIDQMATSSIVRSSKIYSNCDFWFENIPKSGNPGLEGLAAFFLLGSGATYDRELRHQRFYNYYNAAVVDVNSKIEGLGPGTDVMILKIFSPKKLATVLPFFCCM
jgi:hypothetical protein